MTTPPPDTGPAADHAAAPTPDQGAQPAAGQAGGAVPASPPGGAVPASPPGGALPASPPGGAAPDSPPGGAAPDSGPVSAPSADIVTGQGGVMTDEAGVITGQLTLRAESDAAGAVTVRVQYKDAGEWYTVSGGHCQLRDPADVPAVLAVVAGILNRPNG